MEGVGTPVAQIETWETVRQMAAPFQLCTKTKQRSVWRFLFSEGVKPYRDSFSDENSVR